MLDPADRLLRRVPHRQDFLEWHDDLQRWVPSLAAIRFDPDGMSVFVRSLLEARMRGPGDVQSLGSSSRNALVFEFLVRIVERHGFAVQFSPNGETTIGFAHASVLRPQTMDRSQFKRSRSALAIEMALALGAITIPAPPGA